MKPFEPRFSARRTALAAEKLRAESVPVQAKLARSILKMIHEQKISADSRARSERRKRAVDLATLGGIWLTAVIALVAVYDTHSGSERQYQVLSDQISEMQREQRAWIQPADIQVSQLRIDKERVWVGATIGFKNVGRGLAIGVEALPTLIFRRDNGAEWERDFCALPKETLQVLLKHGYTLFPDNSNSTKLNFGTPKLEFESSASKWIEDRMRDFGSKIPMPLEEFRSRVSAAAKRSTLALGGCIVYGIPGSSDLHGTSFYVYLTRKAAGDALVQFEIEQPATYTDIVTIPQQNLSRVR